MDTSDSARKQVLDTLAWTPFQLCEDEVADADRFYKLLQLAALVSSEETAKDVIYAALKERIHELTVQKADEIDAAHDEDRRRDAHDRAFYDTFGGL